jgi:hypothetical protein
MRQMYSVYFTQMYFSFIKYQESSATVTQLTIKLYNSMVYYVAPMCHYSKQRKELFCFLRTKMSKNSPILRGSG